MPILREKLSWSIPRRRSPAELTPDEQAGVRRALKALRVRHGVKVLAKLARCSAATLSNAASKRAPTVSTALLLARVAGVPVSDVLRGEWPRLGECPLCGHVTGGKVGDDE